MSICNSEQRMAGGWEAALWTLLRRRPRPALTAGGGLTCTPALLRTMADGRSSHCMRFSDSVAGYRCSDSALFHAARQDLSDDTRYAIEMLFKVL